MARLPCLRGKCSDADLCSQQKVAAKIVRPFARCGGMTDILSKLSALTGPNFAVEQEIGRMFAHGTANSIFPAYTASIDAAMTLLDGLPVDWDRTVGIEDGQGWANVNPNVQPFPVEMDITETAATPAIALCIASLKARGLIS